MFAFHNLGTYHPVLFVLHVIFTELLLIWHISLEKFLYFPLLFFPDVHFTFLFSSSGVEPKFSGLHGRITPRCMELTKRLTNSWQDFRLQVIDFAPLAEQDFEECSQFALCVAYAVRCFDTLKN